MTDPYIEKVIEENEERAEELDEETGDKGLAKEMDDFFEPIFGGLDRLGGDDRNRDDVDAVENDRAQRPD